MGGSAIFTARDVAVFRADFSINMITHRTVCTDCIGAAVGGRAVSVQSTAVVADNRGNAETVGFIIGAEPAFVAIVDAGAAIGAVAGLEAAAVLALAFAENAGFGTVVAIGMGDDFTKFIGAVPTKARGAFFETSIAASRFTTEPVFSAIELAA